MSEIAIYLLCLVIDIILLFLTVYFIITLSDLECDYINARTCCDKLNKFVVPEVIIRIIPLVLFLVNGHWILFLINAPLVAWYVFRYLTKPASHIGLFDPAEIHNRGELKVHMKYSMIKLGEHLVLFFIYLYCLIMSLVGSSSSTHA